VEKQELGACVALAFSRQGDLHLPAAAVATQDSALDGKGKVPIQFLRRIVPPTTRPLITYFVGMKASSVGPGMTM
jgi:hypothetical protein